MKMLPGAGNILRFLIMYAIFFIFIFKMASSDLVVQTNSGLIRGVTSMMENVEAFLGIPYAEPPIKELRFAKPLPKKPWTETLNTSKLPPPCAQFSYDFPYHFMPDITNMSEDCLYLNIWVPKPISNNALKPVVIFIHGGAFYSGSSCMKAYDGTNFAAHGDIIIVTVNYRVGAFGYFLSFTEEAAGNMGMYDQVMAIKWVKNNVVHFGGDPDNIVLFGVSAGAISVAAHMVSPISKHLFQKAIIQSGGIAHPFFFSNNTRVFQNSQLVASITGCANTTVDLLSDPGAVVKCLKRQPVEAIVEAEKSLRPISPFTLYPIENDEFLPQSGINLLREGKFNKDVPILTGINYAEGGLMLIVTIPEFLGVYGKTNDPPISKNRAAVLIRGLMQITNITNATNIIDYYINSVTNRSTLGYVKTIANMVGDFIIACSTVFQANFLSLKGNPVYLYKFGFRSPSTPFAKWTESTHLDEIQYVFGNPYHENFTNEEVELSHRLMERWSAFARTGNPNIPGHVPWLRYSYQNPYYLNIEQEEESICIKPLERCQIWKEKLNSVIESI